MNSISWSPDNQELLAVAHPINGPKVQNPCLVQRKSKSVICGAENIFTGFTEHEYQLLSVVRSYAWSPIDKTQIAFILEFSIGQFKPGIYLLDNNEKQISILMEYPAESLRFDPNQKIIWSPDGKKLTFALYSDTTQYPNERNYFLEIVSIDISGKNFTLLFNTHDIYKKTAGIIPADFQDVFPIIYISSWLPDNEYILFEAVWKTPNILQDYLLGIFVYNIRTNETTKIKGIETISVGVAYQNHRLNPSWAP